MGCPLSKFQYLAKLCKEEEYTVELFSQFYLTAIVLHNPDDVEFKNIMESNFENLHKCTGERFLFVTFIDNEVRNEWNLVDVMSSGVDFDEIDFVHNLAKRLDLKQFPVILLTDNLNDSRYITLNTDKERIVSQLESIGSYVSLQNRRFSIQTKLFADFLQTLGDFQRKETIDNEYLSTNIADILAIHSLTDDGLYGLPPINNEQTTASIQIEDAINRLQSAYLEIRDNFEAQSEKLYSLLEILTHYFYIVITKEQHIYRFKESNPKEETEFFDKLTSDSQIFYNTFNSLNGYYNSKFINIHDDYSPLSLNLCKIIEEELNASIVQLIRQIYGIRMPKYYRIHDRRRGRVEVGNNLINQYDRNTGKLCTVTIGGIINMLQYLNDDRLIEYCRDEFIDKLETFRDYRNMAAHPRVLSEEDFLAMKDCFYEILKNWIDLLNNLKQRLQHE